MNTSVAVILAAGKGSRLQPLSDTRPKVLMPIAGKPLLWYNIERVARCGIREIVIVVGEDEGAIRAAFQDGASLGVRLRYVRQAQPLGTAHALQCAIPLLNGDPFLLTFGDNMTPFDLTRLLTNHQEQGHVATLCLKRAADPTKHGGVELEGHHVVGLEEKPTHPKSDLTMAGMYVFEPGILEAVCRTRVSDSGEYYLPDALQMLLSEGHEIGYVECDSWRTNVNTPAEMLETNRVVLCEGHAADPARFGGGTVPPNHVAPSAEVAADCRIGPHVSLGERGKVGAGVRLENCILFDGVEVGAGAELRDGIFGENSRMAPAYVTPPGEGPRIYAADGEYVS